MTGQPLDPATIMAAHRGQHRCVGGDYVSSRTARYMDPPCEVLLLAEALQASERALAAERLDNRITHGERDDALSSLSTEIECRQLAQSALAAERAKVQRAQWFLDNEIHPRTAFDGIRAALAGEGAAAGWDNEPGDRRYETEPCPDCGAHADIHRRGCGEGAAAPMVADSRAEWARWARSLCAKGCGYTMGEHVHGIWCPTGSGEGAADQPQQPVISLDHGYAPGEEPL